MNKPILSNWLKKALSLLTAGGILLVLGATHLPTALANGADDPEENLVENLEVDPKKFDFEDGDQEVKIEFTLTEEADLYVKIYDKKTNKIVETLEDDEDMDADDYDFEWEPEEEGKYYVKVRAKTKNQSDVDKKNVTVKGEKSASTPTITYKKLCNVFNDVFRDSEYCDAVEWAVENGVFRGYKDGQFKPNKAINRVEALKTIMLALNIYVIQDTAMPVWFTDVSENAWYINYVKTAKARGIIHGYGDGTLYPEKQLVKTEALSMLLNAVEYKKDMTMQSCNSLFYADIDPFAWYSDAVCYAATYNLTEDDGPYFQPNQLFTRGEMVKLLYNFYKEGLVS